MSETTICANYKFADDWHVFTCDELPGLYVASKDAEKAYNDVGPSIETLMRLDRGIECQARPVLDFKEWLADEADGGKPRAIRSRRFVLAQAAA